MNDWITRFFERFNHFWKHDPGMTHLLVVLCLLLFVFRPITAVDTVGNVLINSFFSLLLISGVILVVENRVLVGLMIFFSILVFVISWIDLYSSDPLIDIVHSLLDMVFYALLAGMVLINVFKKGPVTHHRVQGAIVAYLLIGIMMSYGYQTIYVWAPQPSFNVEPTIKGQFENDFGFMYFSFTTLTSLGYGDITPIHPYAQSLSVFEGLCGQLYPVILIARLVSQAIDTKQ